MARERVGGFRRRGIFPGERGERGIRWDSGFGETASGLGVFGRFPRPPRVRLGAVMSNDFSHERVRVAI